MLSGMTPSAMGLASFFRRNNIDLGQTLMRLASGKKINNPSDDSVGYLRAKDLASRANNYENLQKDLAEYQSAMETASSAADTVYDNLARMKELIYMAEQKIGSLPDPDIQNELDSYQTEFEELARANRSLVQDTNWRGTSLLNNAGTIATLYLQPGSTTSSLVLEPGTAVDVATDLTPLITDTANHSLNVDAAKITAAEGHVDSATSDVKSFIGTVSGYVSNLKSQQNVGQSIIENLRSAESTIMDINEAEEMITFTNQDIRRQSSLAMLAQANMASSNVMWLYGIKQGG